MNVSIVPVIEYQEMPVLKDKKVLIVGGTHGVGEALARKCMSGGAKVTVIGLDYNEDLNCDQSIYDVVKCPEAVEMFYMGQNYIFNNIGLFEKNTILDTPRKRLQEVLKANIETMFILTGYSIKYVRDVVVNMASRPTWESYHSWGLYALSKQAVITMTKAAAEEGCQKFYPLCSSRIDTKFRDIYFPDEDKATRLTPEEVADVILQLFNGKNPSGQEHWMRRVI